MLKARFWAYSKEYNSTAHPTNAPAVELDIELKTPTDIISPTLILTVAASDINYNYCYIPAFKRYYRVTNWEYIGGLWSCSLSVDVLASWRDDIGKQNLYVLRSSAVHDGAIQDNTYLTTANITKTKVTGADLWGDTYSEGVIVFGVLSGNGGTVYYQMSISSFASLLDYLFSDAYAEALLGAEWTTIYPELKAQVNPLQYLTSIMYIPVSGLAIGGGVANLRVGWVNTPIYATTVPAQVIHKTGNMSVPQHPQAGERGKYLNMPPYSLYSMFVPAFGTFDISAADIFAGNGSITYDIALDPRTGHATMQIRNSVGEVFSYLSSQIGVPYQVSQVYNKGYGVGTAIQQAASIASSFASGGPSGVVSGIAGAASALGDIAASRVPSARTVGSNGSLDALGGNVAITATFYRQIDEDLAHRGRPLCQKRTLNTIPGFIMCADADIKINATETELDAIRGLLEEGIIYV